MVRASTNAVIASDAARAGTVVGRAVASFGRNVARSVGENVARNVGKIVEIARITGS
jgi:hypothetical protein